ncbi:MAG: hypothetical protein KatS3mg029_0253 [Saprospiraceae bacterium]|nr:MAG: hypothetical protein KatS3mg029_0253 [Saprospiraceae bacterium]
MVITANPSVQVDQLDDDHGADEEEEDLRNFAKVVQQHVVDAVEFVVVIDHFELAEGNEGPTNGPGQQGRYRLVEFERVFENDCQVSCDENGNDEG